MHYIYIIFSIFSTITQSKTFLQTSKKHAASVLKSKSENFNNIEEWEEVVEIKNRWHNKCRFSGGLKWEEFKDELEETALPEEEVDRLERCTNPCGIKEFELRKSSATNSKDKSYSEMGEEREEDGLPFEPACKQCFEAIPKSAGFNFDLNSYCDDYEHFGWRDSNK